MDRTLDLVAISPWLAPSLRSEDPAKRITCAEARKHIGQSAAVTGRVVQVASLEKVVYLNLDQPHPQTPFTVVIFPPATNQFGDLRQLEGKLIEVTGKVIEFRDRPEIVISKRGQLKVLDELPAAKN